jgi:hypothetical protein
MVGRTVPSRSRRGRIGPGWQAARRVVTKVLKRERQYGNQEPGVIRDDISGVIPTDERQFGTCVLQSMPIREAASLCRTDPVLRPLARSLAGV